MSMKNIVLLGGSHNGERVRAEAEDALFVFDESPAYEGDSIVNQDGKFVSKDVGSFVNWTHYKRTGEKETYDAKEYEVFEFHAKGEGFRDLDGFLRDKPGGELIR